MTIEAMKQALEALGKCRYRSLADEIVDPAITALRTAIAEAEKQGPVAWMDEFGNVFPLGAQRGPKYLNEPMKPLYTTPPAALVQEPVAAQCKFDREVKWGWCEIAHHNLVQVEPQNWPGYQTRLLYTTPQPCPTCEALARTVMMDQTAHDTQRQPLTDEGIEALWNAVPNQALYMAIKVFARAIEAAHGIKEKT
jgi:hypothetical protein